VVGQNGPLLGRLATELRYCCTIDDLRSYYQDRYYWSADQYKMVDETGIQKVMSSLKGGQSVEYNNCDTSIMVPRGSREPRKQDPASYQLDHVKSFLLLIQERSVDPTSLRSLGRLVLLDRLALAAADDRVWIRDRLAFLVSSDTGSPWSCISPAVVPWSPAGRHGSKAIPLQAHHSWVEELRSHSGSQKGTQRGPRAHGGGA